MIPNVSNVLLICSLAFDSIRFDMIPRGGENVAPLGPFVFLTCCNLFIYLCIFIPSGFSCQVIRGPCSLDREILLLLLDDDGLSFLILLSKFDRNATNSTRSNISVVQSRRLEATSGVRSRSQANNEQRKGEAEIIMDSRTGISLISDQAVLY